MTSLSYVSDEQLLETAGFSPDRFRLGKICMYGHNWLGTGKSLRYKEHRSRCYDCRGADTMGIYRITCNNEYYYGLTTNRHVRWTEHKRKLKDKKHHSYLLQKAYKASKGICEYEMIVTLKPEFTNRLSTDQLEEVLTVLEQTFFTVRDPSLNVSKISGSCLNIKHSEESNKAKSDRQKKPYRLYHPVEGYIEGIGLKDFAKSKGLNYHPLYDVNNGIAVMSQGFFRSEESYHQWIASKPQPVRFFHKDDGWIEVPHLYDWCKENKFSSGTLIKVLKGQEYQYKGFFKSKEDFLAWNPKQKLVTFYHATEGYIQTRNVKDLAESRGLSPGNLSNVVTGIKPSCGGLYISEESYDREMKKKSSQSSQYTGVKLIKKTGRWNAYFYDGNKVIHVGNYDTELEAHIEREKARTKYMLETRGVA